MWKETLGINQEAAKRIIELVGRGEWAAPEIAPFVDWERLGAMEGVSESFKRLYAALTPEQKATADQYFNRMGPGKAGGRPGPASKRD